MLLELRPERATMAFEGLENVRDPRSASSTLARFSVADGVAGPKREA